MMDRAKKQAGHQALFNLDAVSTRQEPHYLCRETEMLILCARIDFNP
jgi:hypothetical protein